MTGLTKNYPTIPLSGKSFKKRWGTDPEKKAKKRAVSQIKPPRPTRTTRMCFSLRCGIREKPRKSSLLRSCEPLHGGFVCHRTSCYLLNKNGFGRDGRVESGHEGPPVRVLATTSGATTRTRTYSPTSLQAC